MRFRKLRSSLLVAVILTVPLGAQAASLYLTPDSTIRSVGEEFEVEVRMDTEDKDISAVEGSLSFEPDRFHVVDVSNEQSRLTWFQEFEYSNETGDVTFGGGSSEPISGQHINVATLKIEALKEGPARLRFSSGAAYASDSTGQNVISSMSSGVYTITVPILEQEPRIEYVAPESSPEAPEVISFTHPYERRWYSQRDVFLSWDVEQDIMAVRTLLTKEESAIPTEHHEPPVAFLRYEGVEGGLWNFFIQKRNEHGWGEIGRYQVRIDTTKPGRFNVTKMDRDDPTDPVARFLFDAHDEGSGMSHYDIMVDNEEIDTFPADEEQIYETPRMSPGDHTLVVQAFDDAGNYLTEVVNFTVRPLKSPTFSDYSPVLSSGSVMTLKGQAQPNSELYVWLEKDGGEEQRFTTTSNEDGTFTFIAPRELDDGMYNIRAQAVDDRGAMSDFSHVATVAVQPPGIIRFGSFAMNVLAVIIPLIALVALLVISMVYAKHRYSLMRSRLDKEIVEVEESVHEGFGKLKKEAEKGVQLLEWAQKRRELTREEKIVMDKLREKLAKTETDIEKEVSDVRKELKSSEFNLAKRWFGDSKGETI